MNRTDRRALFCLCALWALLLLIAWPRGPFPLDDDFAGALVVRRLLETGRYQPHGWLSMNFVSQALWGALFGGSFQGLRLSTQLLALVGMLATWGLVREAGAEPLPAALGAAALLVHPIWFALSSTFMTDVPLTALLALSLWLHARARRLGSSRLLLAAHAVSLFALLDRQNGIAVPIAAFLCSLLLDRAQPRRIALAALGLNAALAVQLGFAHWLRVSQPPAALQHYGKEAALFFEALRGEHELHPFRNAAVLSLYLGLSLLPAALALQTRRAWIWLLASVPIALFVVQSDLALPLIPNILRDLGVGPLTLKGALFNLRGPSPWPRAPQGVWAAVTALAALGALRVLWELRLVREPARVLALACVVVLAGPLFFVPLHDRYVLPFLPPLLALLAPGLRVRPAAMAALALSAAFSVCATHDWFAWNRARWSLLARLHTQGVTPARIDGGFEFNGLRSYRPDYSAQRGKSTWWVQDDEYVVAFAPLPGRTVTDEAKFTRWLPPGEGSVLVLKR